MNNIGIIDTAYGTNSNGLSLFSHLVFSVFSRKPP